MSKMSQLSLQLDELVRCGEELVRTAQALKEFFSGEDAVETIPEKEAAAPAAKESKAKAKKEPAAESAGEEKKALTLEDVRTILAEKSRDGFTEEVKAIIMQHGAKKLSGIDPADYEAIVAEVEGLGNA